MVEGNFPGAVASRRSRPAERLLLVGTGALSVCFLPYWVNWIGAALPGVSLKVALTRSATRLVSQRALAVLSGAQVMVDEWEAAPATEAPHVRLATWPDVIAVCPSTMDFTARFAQGRADSPVMAALQTTRAVIGIAPALPPGALDNPVTSEHLRALARRPRVVVAPMETAESASTGELEATAQAPLSDLWTLIDQRWREVAGMCSV